MDPDVHARVARTAKAIGIDLNGLLNLLIHQNLPIYETMASCSRDFQWAALLFPRWLERNPDRLRRDELAWMSDVLRLFQGRPLQFEDGKWYCLNHELTDFVETAPPRSGDTGERARFGGAPFVLVKGVPSPVGGNENQPLGQEQSPPKGGEQ